MKKELAGLCAMLHHHIGRLRVNNWFRSEFKYHNAGFVANYLLKSKNKIKHRKQRRELVFKSMNLNN